MSEKLEKALSELDTLLEEVNMLRKEEEDDEKMMERASKEEGMEMADDEEEDMEMAEYQDEEEDMDEKGNYEKEMDADKAYLRTLDGAGNQIGEPADRIVINNGKPTSSDMPVVKAFSNNEFDSLDLSNSNIEKAYAAFREEQLEALAYDNLRKSFESRFASERANRENILAKSQYDAASEISSLKEEFTQLRKSLTAEKDSIIKAQEEATIQLPSLEDISEMEWSDIHKMVNNI